MLVHSLNEGHAWFDDFQDFTGALGIPVDRVNHLSAPIELEGITLRLGWVADQLQP